MCNTYASICVPTYVLHILYIDDVIVTLTTWGCDYYSEIWVAHETITHNSILNSSRFYLDHVCIIYIIYICALEAAILRI